MTATPATITASTPGAGYVASLAPATRPGAVASLTRAAKLAAGHDYADGTAHPWHRQPVATLRKVRADLRAGFAPGTANQSLAAIRGALRVAWQDGSLDHGDYSRRVDALKSVPGSPAPGRVLTVAQVRDLFAACAADPNRGAGGEGRRANGGLVRSWPPEGRSASDPGRRPGPGRRDAHRPGQGWPGQAGLYRRERGRRRYRSMAQDPGRPRRPVVRARESGGAGQRRGNEPPGNQRAGGPSGPASRIGRPPGVPRPAAIVRDRPIGRRERRARRRRVRGSPFRCHDTTV